MKEVLTEKEIDTYIRLNTSSPKVLCDDCGDDALYWDEYEGENFCRSCLVKSLNSDMNGVREILK